MSIEKLKKQRESTEIQTLIFGKDRFKTAAEAKLWATENGFKAPKVDETGDSFRLRQRAPRDFKEGTFRTIALTDEVKAVVAVPKDDAKKQYTGEKKKQRIVAGDSDMGSAGMHQHKLNRINLQTDIDGAHKHAFLVNENFLVFSDHDGLHSHTMDNSESGRMNEESSSHKHKVTVGEIDYFTNDDGAHEHEAGVISTGEDGSHSHILELADGTTIKSLTASEYFSMVEMPEEDEEDEEEVEFGFDLKEAAFVGAVPNMIDMVRKEAFTGPVGAFFRDNYLAPLGLTRDSALLVNIFDNILLDDRGEPRHEPQQDEIEKSLPLIVAELDKAAPRCVIAVGKTAKIVLGDLADFCMPHPAAVKKHGDSGEISRKVSHIAKSFDTVGHKQYHKFEVGLKDKTDLVSKKKTDKIGPAEIKICKLDDEKQVVYGVVLDPYHVDTQNDWVAPGVIEETAHRWLANHREHNINHRDDAGSDTFPVESFVVEYPSHDDYMKARKGMPHRAFRRKYGNDIVHSGAWIVGTKVSDEVWESVKAGRLQGYSIEGLGVRRPTTTLEMPEVTFVDIGIIGEF